MREYTKEEAAAIVADKLAKAERRNELADKRQADADAASKRASDAVSGIPFGQPIIAGHYSAKRHRAAYRRADAATGRAVENYDKRDYHRGKAVRAEAWANEVARRADGAVYERADLQPGDRLNDTNRPGGAHCVVVRVNAKTISAYPVYGAPFDSPTLAPIFAACSDFNPLKVKYLKVREAWREVDGVWTAVQGTGPGAGA